MASEYETILSCSICKNLPQKDSVNDVWDGRTLPKEIEKLISLSPPLKRCPECGTYYYYEMEHDPGEGGGLDPSSNTFTIVRYNSSHALSVLEDISRKNKRLKGEYQKYEKNYPKIIQNLAESLCLDVREINQEVKNTLSNP